MTICRVGVYVIINKHSFEYFMCFDHNLYNKKKSHFIPVQWEKVHVHFIREICLMTTVDYQTIFVGLNGII